MIQLSSPLQVTETKMVVETKDISVVDFRSFGYSAGAKEAYMQIQLTPTQETSILVKGADFDALVAQNWQIIKSIRGIMLGEAIKQGILPEGTVDTWPTGPVAE